MIGKGYEDQFTHKDGIWWYDAPLPWHWHRCQVWSSGWLYPLTHIERCACGAARMDGGPWIEKNSRRNGG